MWVGWVLVLAAVVTAAAGAARDAARARRAASRRWFDPRDERAQEWVRRHRVS